MGDYAEGATQAPLERTREPKKSPTLPFFMNAQGEVDMLRRQALRLGIALFAAMSAVSAQYESSLETLSGVVRGRDCTPIEGVSVTATSRATTESQTATTDADGLYSLVLVPGRYKIKVAAPGFPDVTIVFEVVADGPNRLDVSVGPGGLMKCKTAPIDVPFSAALHTGTA